MVCYPDSDTLAEPFLAIILRRSKRIEKIVPSTPLHVRMG
ncbi:hypothetical protein NMY3_02113 [Candidatus Nitrosocosmicus oleophilus]|uniref:Uncharacterized protein n=1 Tax=Candidatus Nitrosocosmicus oleophilus TaxID=1353260 RepID=A0A654LXS9_9ARCH|nr:hypothetical protein NMY3_02113 [Candidatus Nitrosocosmicus oleophilus]